MGLLDDLLGVSDPAESRRSGGARAQSGGGTSQLMMALLPVVLSMLANRGGGQQSGSRAGRGDAGGGLGGLLGSLLGGGQGGRGGGLGDLLEGFKRAGYGDQAQSWVGRGQNQPLPSDALAQVFGQGGLAEIARRAGVSEDDASRGLSSLLPEVVDQVTPEGRVPDESSLAASVDALVRRYGVR